LTLPQTRWLLCVVLPRARFDRETAIQYVSYLQRRNHAAYLAHRQATRKRLDGL